jgi:hypothetical protein
MRAYVLQGAHAARRGATSWVRLSYVGLDGSKNDHLTTLSLVRRGGSGVFEHPLDPHAEVRASRPRCSMRLQVSFIPSCASQNGLGLAMCWRAQWTKLPSRSLGDAAVRISSSTSAKLHARIQRDAAGRDATRWPRSCHPRCDQLRGSVDSSPSQQIRTHRRSTPHPASPLPWKRTCVAAPRGLQAEIVPGLRRSRRPRKMIHPGVPANAGISAHAPPQDVDRIAPEISARAGSEADVTSGFLAHRPALCSGPGRADTDTLIPLLRARTIKPSVLEKIRATADHARTSAVRMRYDGGPERL